MWRCVPLSQMPAAFIRAHLPSGRASKLSKKPCAGPLIRDSEPCLSLHKHLFVFDTHPQVFVFDTHLEGRAAWPLVTRDTKALLTRGTQASLTGVSKGLVTRDTSRQPPSPFPYAHICVACHQCPVSTTARSSGCHQRHIAAHTRTDKFGSRSLVRVVIGVGLC